MRKKILTATASILLACSPLFATNGFADDTSTTSTASTATTDSSSTDTGSAGTDNQQGLDTSVLRPGADPNDPNAYAYLPPDMSIPVEGPRTEWPSAPSASDSISSTSSTFPQIAPALSAPDPSNTSALPNIAVGKLYTLGTQWPDATFAKSEMAYANTGQLTDGQFATLKYSDKGWVGFLRQGGHSITVDLGSVQRVDRVSLDFLQNLGAGIDFPDRVTYYASDDGTTWHRLGSAVTTQGGGSYTPQTQPYTIDAHIQAQYIRAQFEAKVFAFADEFSVFAPAPNNGNGNGPGSNQGNGNPLPGPNLTAVMGNNYLYDPNEPKLLSLKEQVQTFASPSGPAGPAGPPPGDSNSALAGLGLPMGPDSDNAQNGGGPSSSLPNPGYLTSSDPGTDGIKNMQLVYSGAPHNTTKDSLGEWTVSDFLPTVAQEDASGTPRGWLFDGTLFGPYGTPATSTAVNSWVTDLFSPNLQLSALNQAVGQVKQQLNDPNYKEKVVINIPGLTANPKNFGPIDSSGQNIDLNPADVGEVQATLNKAKVIQWFMQTVLSDWNSAGLSNLEFAGFYWQPETLNAADPLDPTLIQYTANLVHHDGSNFFWIPYYGGWGISEWQQLGFDDVTCQAGVAFNYSIHAAPRLQSVAQMGQFYHVGQEMEQPYNTMSSNTAVAQNNLNHFYDYFTGGNVYGYEGNSEKTWYLNSKGLVGPYQSQNPFYHAQYDSVVQFVNGQWTGTTFY